MLYGGPAHYAQVARPVDNHALDLEERAGVAVQVLGRRSIGHAVDAAEPRNVHFDALVHFDAITVHIFLTRL